MLFPMEAGLTFPQLLKRVSGKFHKNSSTQQILYRKIGRQREVMTKYIFQYTQTQSMDCAVQYVSYYPVIQNIIVPTESLFYLLYCTL
jgi:hypothetical protein